MDAKEVDVGPVGDLGAPPEKAQALPELESGDHLARDEFERRYAAMPGKRKAELIEGIVYVTSPVKPGHSRYDALAQLWIARYAAATPGTESHANATLRLGERSEIQPDAFLCITPAARGRLRVDEGGYFAGTPELAIEVAASSASADLHAKKALYLAHGCPEYLVVVVHSAEVVWFASAADRYERVAPDGAGVLRSAVFPGLWLDARAFLAGDGARLLTTLEAGLASGEHASFVEALRARRHH